MAMKLRIFIGSSSEGLDVAYALQNNLDNDGEVTVWKQDVFRPSEFLLESLLKQLDATDAAIFVFSPDDTVVIRGQEYPAIRDNVVFELGLYIGRLGRERCFIVFPRGSNPRLPSDLLGVSVVNYDGTRTDGHLEAALGAASNKIRLALRKLTPTPSPPSDLLLGPIEKRGLLSVRQRELLTIIETEAAVSKTEIARRMKDIVRSELHYRLEHLRLLQLVVVSNSSEEPSADSELVTLHPLYEQALRGKHNLGTT